jgi:subtilisin family serine protease
MTKRKTALILIIGAFVLIGTAVGLLLTTDAVSIRSRPPDPAVTLTPPTSLADLSSRYPELAGILQDPELGSIYKEFLIAYQDSGQEAAIAMAKERGLLTPDGESLRVTLVLDTEESEDLQQQLKAFGMIVVSAYQDQINVAVPVDLVIETMNAEDVRPIFERLTELRHVIAVRLPRQHDTNAQAIVGEGIEVINADAWHDAAFTGEGLHIGVLDLGFAGHQALLGEELPDQVQVSTFGWYDDENTHGTACAEIIHEVAPDARLSFAWYDGSNAALGEAVEWLTDQKVEIISHSAGGVASPRDGTGWSARLVDEISSQGVLWVNAAGNEAISHYRGSFEDQDGDGYHEYARKDEMLTIYNGGELEVYLLWDDSWTSAAQDYDLYLVDAEGEEVAASEDTQNGTQGQNPVERIQIASTDDPVLYAVVMAYETDRAATFDIFADGHGVEIPESVPAYSLGTPSDATGALAVGAVDWDDDRIAVYSSQGPTNDERLKPEISAPTGVSGATYGGDGFDGTSASAPHVAGAAALIWQAYPAFKRRDVFDYLLAATEDLGPAGPDTVYGYGHLVLPDPPVATPAPKVTPTPTASSRPDSTPTSRPTTATPVPRLTPTAVDFVTPTPASPEGSKPGAGLTTFGLIIGSIGLSGLGLLVTGAVLLTQSQSSSGQAVHSSVRIPPTSYRPLPSHPPTEQLPAQTRGRRDARARCPTCGADLRPLSRFCRACGRPVTGSPHSGRQAQRIRRYCRHCGAKIRATSRFCSQCGRKLSK